MEQQLVAEVVDTALKYSGFTPLEIVLMSTIVGVAVAFYKFVKNAYSKMLVAITNNTNATNELIQELRRNNHV